MKSSTFFIMLLGTISYSPIVPAQITSADIMTESLSFTCIDWKATGVCFWLKCSVVLPSCSVETSLKVKHYNPDAIVQIYQTPGEVPWGEMSFVSEMFSLGQSGSTPTNTKQSSGQGLLGRSKQVNSNKSKKQNSKIMSRHVDVIGSPGLIPVTEWFSRTEYGCGSGASMYRPYFVSTLDYFSWRFPYTDFLSLATFVPGMREVGERNDGGNENFLFIGRFGNVFPRIGSLMQNDTYKASTVFAQRAADIVTEPQAMHIYNFLGEKDSKDGWWPPGQIQEWSSAQGKWQMLYPMKESTCHIFGEPSTRAVNNTDVGSHLYDGYQKRRSQDGNYAWQLWRPYECCEKKGKLFLYSIAF